MAEAPPPEPTAAEIFAAKIAAIPGVVATRWALGELSAEVNRDAIVSVGMALRDGPGFQFEQLMDLCGVDWPTREPRFDVVYNLLSVSLNQRLRLIVKVGDGEPVPSTHTVWPAATWWEREAWDLFGIVFDGHPGLTRIQMPDDWPGHPQRKDYPLGGIPVEFKGAQVDPPDQRRAYT